MSTMSMDGDGEVTFHPPDSARKAKAHLEYWEWALLNVRELERQAELGYLPFRVTLNLMNARRHCAEQLKALSLGNEVKEQCKQ